MIALITLICFFVFDGSWLTFWLLTPSLLLLDTEFLWVRYLAVMHLQEVRDAGLIHQDAVILAKTVLYTGLLADVLYNLTWAMVLFLDPPRELLVTTRLKRYKYGANGSPPETGWRLRRTDWFAEILLDDYDPSGKHV